MNYCWTWVIDLVIVFFGDIWENICVWEILVVFLPKLRCHTVILPKLYSLGMVLGALFNLFRLNGLVWYYGWVWKLPNPLWIFHNILICNDFGETKEQHATLRWFLVNACVDLHKNIPSLFYNNNWVMAKGVRFE